MGSDTTPMTDIIDLSSKRQYSRRDLLIWQYSKDIDDVILQSVEDSIDADLMVALMADRLGALIAAAVASDGLSAEAMLGIVMHFVCKRLGIGSLDKPT